ncbi:MAG: glycosyltransferase [Methanocellales archaeon]|nr:glycosyltransferase [Methanocellales archaeon]
MKEQKISVIIPTLNEEKYITLLLQSLEKQTLTGFEVIIVDAGSQDRTTEIAKNYDVQVLTVPDAKERGGIAYQRNCGAELAKGDVLAFTEADVILPATWLQAISEKFDRENDLIAVAGPGFPYDAPLIGKLEYYLYNLFRVFISRLPHPYKRFFTSGYNMAVKRNVFEQLAGFDVSALINDDGLFGRKLLQTGKVNFCYDLYVFISARRMSEEGFIQFNRHYLFMLENLFYPLSHMKFFNAIKIPSSKKFYERKTTKNKTKRGGNT